MDIEELKTLVVRAQEGNLEAYSALVRRFQDMAVGYAYSLLGDFHLAEDAAQEAFVGLYLDLHRLREPASFLGWSVSTLWIVVGSKAAPLIGSIEPMYPGLLISAGAWTAGLVDRRRA